MNIKFEQFKIQSLNTWACLQKIGDSPMLDGFKGTSVSSSVLRLAWEVAAIEGDTTSQPLYSHRMNILIASST